MIRNNFFELELTGHPLIDVGIAAIAAFSKRSKLIDITSQDLDAIADYMATNYTQQPLQSFLTVVFMNSGFVQGAFSREKRLEYADEVLRAYKRPGSESDDPCVFFPNQRAVLRGERKHIPLVTGATSINFHPGGDPGIPMSGMAMLCMHAMPLGCAKCAGRLLAVHSNNEEIMLHFADKFVAKIVRQTKPLRLRC